MMKSRNPNARHGEDGGPGSGRPLDAQIRRKWRLGIAIVILSLLGGLAAARLWWPAAGQPPGKRTATGLSPVPIPVLKLDLDPSYRASMEEALEATRRVIEAFPNDAEATVVVAAMNHYAHDGAGEEACWRRCLELDSGFSRAYQALASLAFNKGRHAEAEATIRQAMAVGCADSKSSALLGTVLMQQGRLEEAALVLENDIRANPRSESTRVLLGQVYLQLKEYEKARDQFEGALLLFPTSTRAYHGLAGAFAKLGLDDDAEKSRAEFERLKAIQQEAEFEKQKGRHDELKTPQWMAEVMTLAGKVYLAHERLEDAERHLLRAAELDPADTVCREALSVLYDRQGKYESAVQIVEELRDLEPGNLAHRKNLGMLHGRLGRLAAAEEVLLELCRRAPQEAVGYAGLAEVYLRANKELPEAKVLASEAVRLQPTAWNYTILAAICEKDGDAEGARAAKKRMEELDSQNPPLRKMRDTVPQRP